MQAATLDGPNAAPGSADAARPLAHRLRAVILARIASGAKGVTKATVAEDLAPYVSHRLSPAQWREALDTETGHLILAGMVAANGQRLEATPAGQAEAAVFFSAKPPLPTAWAQIRDTRLLALALGLEKEPAKRLKALGKPEGLRAAILQKAFGLKIKGVPTPSRVRAALAGVALDRAFGNRGREGFGGKLGLSAKAGRTLAGQLARRPRDFGTDARLVAALAAEQAGAVQLDMGALQQAILRRFLDGEKNVLAPVPVAATPVRKPRAKKAKKPQQAAPSRAELPSAPAAAPAPAPVATLPLDNERPDLAGFSKTVRQLAARDAQGWAGNRKAYISHIWRRLSAEHSAWGLSEIEFKCMLAEAHRAGHVLLANADLKDASSLKDLQDSAVVYKNAVFHFVRVEA